MSTPDWKLTSSAFSEGETIPKRHTGDGPDVSPPLEWTDPPEGTQEFVLITDDPDAPVGLFTHWLLYGLPPGSRQLSEAVPNSPEIPYPGKQGRNDFRSNNVGYRGPAPPPGKPHRYYFTLYALDTKLNVDPGVNRQTLEKAMQGHVLAKTQLMGRYGR